MSKFRVLFCFFPIILIFTSCDLLVDSESDNVTTVVENSDGDSITEVVIESIEDILEKVELTRSSNIINYSGDGYSIYGEYTSDDYDLEITFDEYDNGTTVISGTTIYNATITNNEVVTADYSGEYNIKYSGNDLEYECEISYDGSTYTGDYSIDSYSYTYNSSSTTTTSTGTTTSSSSTTITTDNTTNLNLPSDEIVLKMTIAETNGYNSCTIDNGSLTSTDRILIKKRNSDSSVTINSLTVYDMEKSDYLMYPLYLTYICTFDNYTDSGVTIDGTMEWRTDYNDSLIDCTTTYKYSRVCTYNNETYTYDYDYEYNVNADGEISYSGYYEINGYKFEYNTNGTIK